MIFDINSWHGLDFSTINSTWFLLGNCPTWSACFTLTHPARNYFNWPISGERRRKTSFADPEIGSLCVVSLFPTLKYGKSFSLKRCRCESCPQRLRTKRPPCQSPAGLWSSPGSWSLWHSHHSHECIFLDCAISTSFLIRRGIHHHNPPGMISHLHLPAVLPQLKPSEPLRISGLWGTPERFSFPNAC